MPLYIDYGKIYGYSSPRIVLSTLEAGNIRDNARLRKNLLEKLAINETDFFLAEQCHSRKIMPVTEVKQNSSVQCDGLYFIENDSADSSAVKSAAAVTVADCVPLFLFVPESKTAAVLHSGWKGTGILADAIQLLKKTGGIGSADLHLVIGPSIRVCCYQVDAERARLFSSRWGKDTVRNIEDSYYIDLVRANAAIAGNAGIRTVHIVEECTVCNAMFGSYRRERANGSSTFTKMAAITGFF